MNLFMRFICKFKRPVRQMDEVSKYHRHHRYYLGNVSDIMFEREYLFRPNVSTIGGILKGAY